MLWFFVKLNLAQMFLLRRRVVIAYMHLWQVSWLKNGGNMNLLPGNTDGRVGMTTKYGLVLNNVQYSDQGVYTCQATNTLGQASNTTRVVVIGTPTYTPLLISFYSSNVFLLYISMMGSCHKFSKTRSRCWSTLHKHICYKRHSL